MRHSVPNDLPKEFCGWWKHLHDCVYYWEFWILAKGRIKVKAFDGNTFILDLPNLLIIEYIWSKMLELIKDVLGLHNVSMQFDSFWFMMSMSSRDLLQRRPWQSMHFGMLLKRVWMRCFVMISKKNIMWTAIFVSNLTGFGESRHGPKFYRGLETYLILFVCLPQNRTNFGCSSTKLPIMQARIYMWIRLSAQKSKHSVKFHLSPLILW